MYRQRSGKGTGKQSEKKGRAPDSSARWPKFALAPYMTTDGAPFYLRGMAEWEFLSCSNIAASRNAGNSWKIPPSFSLEKFTESQEMIVWEKVTI